MESHKYIDASNEAEMKSTMAPVIDNTMNDVGTEGIIDRITFVQPNQTISNTGVTLYSSMTSSSTEEEKKTNYNKPWRLVIRRRVIDGDDDYKSQNQ